MLDFSYILPALVCLLVLWVALSGLRRKLDLHVNLLHKAQEELKTALLGQKNDQLIAYETLIQNVIKDELAKIGVSSEAVIEKVFHGLDMHRKVLLTEINKSLDTRVLPTASVVPNSPTTSAEKAVLLKTGNADTNDKGTAEIDTLAKVVTSKVKRGSRVVETVQGPDIIVKNK